MVKKEKTKIDARFLDECEEEFMTALKSGELHKRMSQSVISIRAERPKELPEDCPCSGPSEVINIKT